MGLWWTSWKAVGCQSKVKDKQSPDWLSDRPLVAVQTHRNVAAAMIHNTLHGQD